MAKDEVRIRTARVGSPCPCARSQLHYAMNEKVLCFHGPLIYEAKVNQPSTSRSWLELTPRHRS